MKKIKTYQSFLESFKFLNENDEEEETQKETEDEGMETEDPTWDEGMETEESPEYDEPMGDEGECDTCD
jgi:hypothetical protein